MGYALLYPTQTHISHAYSSRSDIQRRSNVHHLLNDGPETQRDDIPAQIKRYDIQGAGSYYAYEENGRTYHLYSRGAYPFPADDVRFLSYVLPGAAKLTVSSF